MIEAARDEGEIVDDRGRCDQDIGIADDRALPFEQTIDLSGFDDNFVVQGQNDALGTLPIEREGLLNGILRLEATKNLVAGDNGELEPSMVGQIDLRVPLHVDIPPLDDFREDVRVEQSGGNGHSGSSRENRLRSRAMASTSATSSSESPS